MMWTYKVHGTAYSVTLSIMHILNSEDASAVVEVEGPDEIISNEIGLQQMAIKVEHKGLEEIFEN